VTPMEIVRGLRDAGHALRLDGEKLIVRPKPSPEISAEIREMKPAIVALLREGLPATMHRYVVWAGARDWNHTVCLSCGKPPQLHGGQAALDDAIVADDLNQVALIKARAIVAVTTAETVVS